jgi:hypothetical protein
VYAWLCWGHKRSSEENSRTLKSSERCGVHIVCVECVWRSRSRAELTLNRMPMRRERMTKRTTRAPPSGPSDMAAPWATPLVWAGRSRRFHRGTELRSKRLGTHSAGAFCNFVGRGEKDKDHSGWFGGGVGLGLADMSLDVTLASKRLKEIYTHWKVRKTRAHSSPPHPALLTHQDAHTSSFFSSCHSFTNLCARRRSWLGGWVGIGCESDDGCMPGMNP